MAERAPGAEDASGLRLLEEKGKIPANAGGLLEAVQQATLELTQPELDALSDASFRSQASRWRIREWIKESECSTGQDVEFLACH